MQRVCTKGESGQRARVGVGYAFCSPRQSYPSGSCEPTFANGNAEESVLDFEVVDRQAKILLVLPPDEGSERLVLDGSRS